MKKILLLIVLIANILTGQETCESKEETFEDLNSITKCSFKPTKKGDGKQTRQIAVKISAPKKRYLKKRAVIKKEVARGVTGLSTSGISKTEHSSDISNSLAIKKEDYKKKSDNLRKKVMKYQTDRRASLDKISTQRAESKKILLDSVSPLVDAYIKANWQTLIANGETRLQFAAAGYPRSITMRVQVEPTDNENTFAFKIYPSNFLIRLFIPALNLMYSDRQLVEYQGYSNLQPDDTESQYVTIQFAHHVTADQLDQPKALWIAKEGPVTQMISAQ